MKYSFDTYKKEHLRYAWLSGKYTDNELIDKYGDAYVNFCFNHGYEIDDSLPQFETVEVVAIVGGMIKTSTSCFRKDSQRYAKYYRSIGYHAKVLTYDELHEMERKEDEERAKMREYMW